MTQPQYGTQLLCRRVMVLDGKTVQVGRHRITTMPGVLKVGMDTLTMPMMTAGGRERWEAGLRMIRDHLPGMVDGWEVQAARLVEGLQIGVGGTAWLVGVVMDGMGGTRTMDGQTHEVMQDGILRPVDGMIKVGNLAGPKQLVMLDGIVHKNLDITMGWTGVVCAEPGNVDNTPEMTRKEVGGIVLNHRM